MDAAKTGGAAPTQAKERERFATAQVRAAAHLKKVADHSAEIERELQALKEARKEAEKVLAAAPKSDITRVFVSKVVAESLQPSISDCEKALAQNAAVAALLEYGMHLQEKTPAKENGAPADKKEEPKKNAFCAPPGYTFVDNSPSYSYGDFLGVWGACGPDAVDQRFVSLTTGQRDFRMRESFKLGLLPDSEHS